MVAGKVSGIPRGRGPQGLVRRMVRAILEWPLLRSTTGHEGIDLEDRGVRHRPNRNGSHE